MPRKTLTGDAGQVQALIAWARANGVDVATVTVGGCRVELVPRVAPAGKMPEREPTAGIYKQFGGEVFKDVAKELGLGELVPALGAR